MQVLRLQRRLCRNAKLVARCIVPALHHFQNPIVENRLTHRLLVRSLTDCKKEIQGVPAIPFYPAGVPNPMVDPSSAGRPGLARSSVCDPNNILTVDTKNVIEGYLNNFKTETGVVIINKMDDNFIAAANSKNEAAGTFAVELHNRWGVGDKAKEDGLLIFISTEDRVVFFSTGSGIQHLLDQSMIRSIVSSMKSDLQKQDYDAAMEFAVLQVRDVLDGNGPQRYGLYGMIIILSLFFLAIREKDKQREAKEKMEIKAEDAALRIYDEDDESCPYCLEAYTSITDEKPVQFAYQLDATLNDSNRVRLHCGHSYCYGCYKDINRRNQDIGGEMQCTCTQCGEPMVIAPIETVEESRFADLSDKGRREEDYRYRSSCYRVGRYKERYQHVVAEEEMSAILREVKSGSGNGTKAVLSYQTKQREERARQKMRDSAAREAARASGSKGSNRTSNSGGSSSGGSGGSW